MDEGVIYHELGKLSGLVEGLGSQLEKANRAHDDRMIEVRADLGAIRAEITTIRVDQAQRAGAERMQRAWSAGLISLAVSIVASIATTLSQSLFGWHR